MIRMMFAFWSLCLLGVTAAPGQALATDSLAARLDAVARIRVHSADGWAELRHPQMVGDSIAFERGVRIDRRSGRRSDVEGPLALTTFDRIEVREGNHAGRGALIGGLIGVGVGLAAGIAMSQDEFFQATTGQVLQITLVSGMTWATVGALIGTAVPRWRSVYRRDGT